MKPGLLFGVIASAMIVGACDMPDADRERDLTRTPDTYGATGTSGTFESADMDAEGAITSEVEANILAHPSLERNIASGDIDVRIEDGTATLTGSVDSPAEQELARSIAWSVVGVDEVNDELSVE
jgi:osmotically-inducible protein OsmY